MVTGIEIEIEIEIEKQWWSRLVQGCLLSGQESRLGSRVRKTRHQSETCAFTCKYATDLG